MEDNDSWTRSAAIEWGWNRVEEYLNSGSALKIEFIKFSDGLDV